MLKISEDYSAPTTQNQLMSTIQEIEKKQSEIAYQADMKLREQVKDELERDFEALRLELPAKIEKDLKVKFEDEAKELRQMYEE